MNSGGSWHDIANGLMPLTYTLKMVKMLILKKKNRKDPLNIIFATQEIHFICSASPFGTFCFSQIP